MSELRTVARGWRWGRTRLVPADAVPHQLPVEHREFPTDWSRTPAAVALRGAVQRYGLRPLLWSQISPRVTGLESLDGLRGPVVFVSNHTSHLDAPLVLTTLPERWRRRTAVAAAADYFFDTWWRGVGSAIAFSTIPLERRAGVASTTARELLDEGWSLVVFPEGTRSPDGWATEFRRGAAHLALGRGVPVVPIAIRGSFAAMPRGRAWPRPGRLPVRIRYGPPVWPAPGDDAAALTDRVHAAVSRLLDEDATDWYGSVRRAAAAETPAITGPPVARWRRVWESTAPVSPGRTTVTRRAPWAR